MIKAKFTNGDGKPCYVFGLSSENLKRLREGMPIHVNLSSMGGAGEVMICWGETEQALLDELQGLIGPTTVVRGNAPGPETPQ